MICPYNRKREKQVLQVVNTYDEAGQNDSTQQIVSTEFDMLECPQAGCVAWWDGRCHYAAISLKNE